MAIQVGAGGRRKVVWQLAPSCTHASAVERLTAQYAAYVSSEFIRPGVIESGWRRPVPGIVGSALGEAQTPRLNPARAV
eukprot:360680-Chlamydomonas_euryale.AAC.3